MENTVKEEFELPMPAGLLLPHRAPMLLVDSLQECNSERAVVLARLPEKGIFFAGDQFLPEFFVELIAQAAALQNGFIALSAGKPLHDGMLVGLEDFSLNKNGHGGERLRVVVEKTFEFGAISFLKGEVFSNEDLLATGNLKVWEDLKKP
ncbi:hypothetical protein [Desulfotalea psychrophila]|nr:hypothetical protein [Desulfotalea psychrophila]